MLAAVPVFGWAVARLPRAKLLPVVYCFFIANILIFYALFRAGIVELAVADVFYMDQCIQFVCGIGVLEFYGGLIRQCTSPPAIRLHRRRWERRRDCWPSVTAVLAIPIGPVNLLLLSALMLSGAVFCIFRLSACAPSVAHGGGAPMKECQPTPPAQVCEPIGGGLLSGIKLVMGSSYLLGICGFIWLFTTLSTFLYFVQAQLVADNFSNAAERTTVFALIDVAVNALTISLQLFVTGRLIGRFGVNVALMSVPVLIGLGFMGLAFAPVLSVLLIFQVIRRAGGYAVMSPAREILFTVVGREKKYKAKNFIDTVVNRGGDAVSAWLFAGLKAMGMGLAAIAVVAVPIAAVWIATALYLGRKQEQLKRQSM